MKSTIALVVLFGLSSVALANPIGYDDLVAKCVAFTDSQMADIEVPASIQRITDELQAGQPDKPLFGSRVTDEALNDALDKFGHPEECTKYVKQVSAIGNQLGCNSYYISNIVHLSQYIEEVNKRKHLADVLNGIGSCSQSVKGIDLELDDDDDE